MQPDHIKLYGRLASNELMTVAVSVAAPLLKNTALYRQVEYSTLAVQFWWGTMRGTNLKNTAYTQSPPQPQSTHNVAKVAVFFAFIGTPVTPSPTPYRAAVPIITSWDPKVLILVPRVTIPKWSPSSVTEPRLTLNMTETQGDQGNDDAGTNVMCTCT